MNAISEPDFHFRVHPAVDRKATYSSVILVLRERQRIGGGEGGGFTAILESDPPGRTARRDQPTTKSLGKLNPDAAG
jgi:hypothetical protein